MAAQASPEMPNPAAMINSQVVSGVKLPSQAPSAQAPPPVSIPLTGGGSVVVDDGFAIVVDDEVEGVATVVLVGAELVEVLVDSGLHSNSSRKPIDDTPSSPIWV